MGSIDKALPHAGFYPDSQNICLDAAKIGTIFDFCKHLPNFFCLFVFSLFRVKITGSYFYDEESSAIKALMFKFARLAATSIEHVAQWLVWLAKELGQLTNMELHRADTEVRDIVDGKYDWRIERYRNNLSV